MGKIVKRTINTGMEPSSKQIKELKDASNREIVFDEDSPEFTYEELLEMVKAAEEKKKEQKKEVVTLRISAAALKKAKATGKGYTGFLGRLIENALNDKDLVMRSL